MRNAPIFVVIVIMLMALIALTLGFSKLHLSLSAYEAWLFFPFVIQIRRKE